MRDFSFTGFEKDLIKLENEVYTVFFSVVDATCHNCFESQSCTLSPPFFGPIE